MEGKKTDLTMPGLYTHSGSMTFPLSSFALLIFSVAKIIEIDMKRELSASLFPGQTLIHAELNGMLMSLNKSTYLLP